MHGDLPLSSTLTGKRDLYRVVLFRQSFHNCISLQKSRHLEYRFCERLACSPQALPICFHFLPGPGYKAVYWTYLWFNNVLHFTWKRSRTISVFIVYRLFRPELCSLPEWFRPNTCFSLVVSTILLSSKVVSPYSDLWK